MGRSGVFVRALAGGAGRRKLHGLGSRWHWAQRRGGLRGGGCGGRRSRRCAFAGPRIAATAGMARADRPMGRQRDHGRRTRLGYRGSGFSLSPARRRWPGSAAPPRRGQLPGKLPSTIASAGSRASACRSVRTRRWRIGWPASYVTVGGIVQAVDRAISDGIAAGASRPAAGGSVAPGRRTWHALSGPPGPDDAGQRRAWLCPRPWREEGGLPFLALALLREAGGSELLREAARAARGTALGRGHPGFRAPRAACRATGRRAGVPAAVCPVRRRTPRPGRRAGTRGNRHLSCTSPRRDCSTSISATALAASCSRARMRRARGPEVQLRPLGAGGRRGGRGTRPRHCRRPR